MTGCWRCLANLRAIRAKISQQLAVSEGQKAFRCVILVYADWYSRNHAASFELQRYRIGFFSNLVGLVTY